MGFVAHEDWKGRVQVALPPQLAETLRPTLAESRILAVGGYVEPSASPVTLLAKQIQSYVEQRARERSTSSQECARRGRHAPSK